jgi:hypothetical protein
MNFFELRGHNIFKSMMGECMSFRRKQESYEELFVQFSRKIERWIIKMLLVLLILLIVLQALMQFPVLRLWMSEVEQMEGKEYKPVIIYSKST